MESIPLAAQHGAVETIETCPVTRIERLEVHAHRLARGQAVDPGQRGQDRIEAQALKVHEPVRPEQLGLDQEPAQLRCGERQRTPPHLDVLSEAGIEPELVEVGRHQGKPAELRHRVVLESDLDLLGRQRGEATQRDEGILAVLLRGSNWTPTQEERTLLDH